MSWVYQAADPHRCNRPVDVTGQAPGVIGDLWRCYSCWKLWRVVDGCTLAPYQCAANHRGQHVVGNSWALAPWWMRLRYAIAGDS